MVPAVTLKGVEAEPTGTVTEAGTVRVELALLESATVTPGEAAAEEIVTVQVEEAEGVKAFGAQVSDEMVGSVRVAEAPVAVRGRADPVREALLGLLTPIAAVVVPAAGITETVATIPAAMVLLLFPETRQV